MRSDFIYCRLKEVSTRFLDDFCTLYLSWIPLVRMSPSTNGTKQIESSDIPVKIYDIVLNSNDGKEIWKKTNQVPQGGRDLKPLFWIMTLGTTISIKNIVADPAVANLLNNQTVNGSHVVTGLNQTNSKPEGDSVKFETSILVN